MINLLTLATSFLLGSSFFELPQLTSAQDIIYCNKTTSNCPSSAPCCSSSGQCGNGTYCMGGCDPRFSFSVDACIPQPVCQSNTWDFTTDIVQSSEKYLGNATDYQWTYESYGHILDYDEGMLLAMPKNSKGTVVSSTFYVWYGKVAAKFRSSHGAGVVSAYILFSNVQDEVDLEFIGSTLEEPQTNYYFQGNLSLTHGKNLSTTNTNTNWHTYELDWTEDSLTWSIDGKAGRVLHKNETYNATTGLYAYPQTPSRIQISIWPGGDSSNAPGTIAWAGGLVDWDVSEFEDPGYLYAMLDSVEVECYDPPSGTEKNGTKSYVYKNNQKDWTSDSVMITDEDTIIGDLNGSGLDRNLDEDDDESSSSASKSSTKTASKDSTKTTAADSEETTGSDDEDSGSGSNGKTSVSSDVSDFVQYYGSVTSKAGAASGSGMVSSFMGLLALAVSCVLL
ncbi:unnamed protein product [Ambrosiozyma monospora]|uniref:Unnamed protein product n=1 Tax=Ambrosiozyma monospora TaxID=43982 RepID=A0ACB5SUK5_AMBMO|nr:unnamed protein product [Ambrosiozyma monospora]